MIESNLPSRPYWRGSDESHKAAQAYIDCKVQKPKWWNFLIGAGWYLGMFALGVAFAAIVRAMV